MSGSSLDNTPLGQRVAHVDTYTPSLLRSVPRAEARAGLGIEADLPLPFHGGDWWTCWEFSWLNSRGKPEVAVLELEVPATSKTIVESKSLKLYLGSFAGTEFRNRAEVISTLESDLKIAARAPVAVGLHAMDHVEAQGLGHLAGQSLDVLDVDIDTYAPDPALIRWESEVVVHRSCFTHALRSVCPVTGQPDWGTLWIDYRGQAVQPEGLLRYVVSLRNHEGFHEHTVERIFCDLMARMQPDELTVLARYTRRGGIDINPWRSTTANPPPRVRVARQ